MHTSIRSSSHPLDDNKTVRVTGAEFVPSPVYQIKLEGVRQLGYRTIFIGGVRDPILISQIDDYLEKVRQYSQGLFPDLDQSDHCRLIYHVYGRNAVMGPLEPENVAHHELGIMGEVVAETQERSRTIANNVRTSLLHMPYEGQLATTGNFASPLSPHEQAAGGVFKFSVYHLIDLNKGEEFSIFPVTSCHVGSTGGAAVEPVHLTEEELEVIRTTKPVPIETRQVSPEPVPMMSIAKVVRSKNSGPFELTLDIMFDDRSSFERVKSADLLTNDTIKKLYQVEDDDILVNMYYDPALAWKCTIKRPWAQGSVGERDTLGTADERRALEFFQTHTADQLSGHFDSAFWKSLVLQLSRSNKAVWHALIAAGAAHRELETSSAQSKLRLVHCNKAIEEIKSAKAISLPILVACILFICTEFLQGDITSAVNHTLHGIGLLDTSEIGILRYFFLRQSFVIGLVGHISPILHSVPDEPFSSPTTLPQARLQLNRIMAAGVVLLDRSTQKSGSQKLNTTEAMDQIRILIWLDKWKHALDEIVDQLPAPERASASVLQLNITYLVSIVTLTTSLSRHETAYDAYAPEFAEIVRLATLFIATRPIRFSFEMEILGPLWFTAAKCRHPRVRRRALVAIWRSRRREGPHDWRRMARMSADVIALEERNLVAAPCSEREGSRCAESAEERTARLELEAAGLWPPDVDESALPPEQDRIQAFHDLGVGMAEGKDVHLKDGLDVIQDLDGNCVRVAKPMGIQFGAVSWFCL
ncbi:uncharacterized protein EJ05DRAFT_387571 [Neofusicoccum parvum]|uniref:Uncharacterized protein EJ05DRAFT_387571 n=1 Tax=Neofusicoccum parvum TaxID=310453 RepID=A0ACB5S277_9PEZI|nr:uncharacterized protein EJ05DRAFT_387571 [Neofusicoccum parvum]